MADTEAKIKIDGLEYPFPDLNSLTMGEWREIKAHYELTPDELVAGFRALEDGRLDPGVLLALVYVAIRRGRADATPRDVVRRLDQYSIDEVVDLYAALNEQIAGGEADPSPTTTEGEPTISTETSDDRSAPIPVSGNREDIGSLPSVIGSG